MTTLEIVLLVIAILLGIVVFFLWLVISSIADVLDGCVHALWRNPRKTKDKNEE